MTVETLQRTLTVDALRKQLELYKFYSDEHNVSYEDMLLVECEGFEKLRYMCSTSRGGVIYKNYFTYSDGQLIGVATAQGGSAKIKAYIPPRYLKVYSAHPQAFIGTRTDGLFDLYIDGQIRVEAFDYYDTLYLGNTASFLQVDKGKHRSLVCFDHWDIFNGVFPVPSQEEFDTWFKDTCRKRGYEGHLDDVAMSGLLYVYYEVNNCIFTVGDFRPIDEL